MIPALGFCLGTRAQMFTLEPGLPATLAPGKRPRTTLSPSLALRPLTPPAQPAQPAQPGQPGQPGQNGRVRPSNMGKWRTFRVASSRPSTWAVAAIR